MKRYEKLVIVSGAEYFTRENGARSVLNGWLKQAGIFDFNYNKVSGRDLALQDLATLIHTPPMMADHRIVHLTEAERLTKDHVELLATRVDNAVASGAHDIAILLVYTEGGRVPTALADRAGRHEQCNPPRRAWEAERWLITHAQDTHGVVLSKSVAEALVGALGWENLGVLASELEKLIALAGGGNITPELVEKATGVRMERTVWALCDHIGERNCAEALTTLRNVLAQPDMNGPRVIYAIATHLTDLGLAVCERNGARDALRSIPDWQAKKLRAQAKNWTLPEIDRALSALAGADRALKTGTPDEIAIGAFLAEVIAR